MTRDEIKRVNERLLYPTPDRQTDVGILLGNAMCSGDIARKTANLYKTGKFSKIILSGGVPQKSWTLLHRRLNNIFRRHSKHANLKLSIPLTDIFTTATEADHMADILQKQGVPKHAIAFTDRQSQNTGENFRYIKDHIETEGYKSATLVCAVFHQRRVLETCKLWLPDLDAATYPVNPYGITDNDWHQKWPQIPFARAAMLGEDFRINPEINPDNNYYKQGYCIPVKIPT